MGKKNLISMRKELTDYHAIILDVDGTLYSQPSLRFGMIFDLLKHYLCHPLHIKDIFIIKRYRSVREHWDTLAIDDSDNSSSIEELQYTYVAQQMNTSPSHVKELVLYWLHTQPLSLIVKYRDRKLIELIMALQEKGTTIAVYSDYPATDKLMALNISSDYVFCAFDEEINCMKPDPKAMYTIMEKLNEAPENILMVGDRYSKDGLAAKNVDIDYLILTKFVLCRRNLLYNWM